MKQSAKRLNLVGMRHVRMYNTHTGTHRPNLFITRSQVWLRLSDMKSHSTKQKNGPERHKSEYVCPHLLRRSLRLVDMAVVVGRFLFINTILYRQKKERGNAQHTSEFFRFGESARFFLIGHTRGWTNHTSHTNMCSKYMVVMMNVHNSLLGMLYMWEPTICITHIKFELMIHFELAKCSFFSKYVQLRVYFWTWRC